MPISNAFAAMVEINQSSTTAAIACLSLAQDDVEQEFIYFEGTSAAGSTASLSSSTAEAAAKTGAILVNINGTDGWIRVYASAI